MTNTIVHDHPNAAQAVVVVVEGDGLDLAYAWGKEDAENGIDRRGSHYFLIGGLYHRAYNDGYDDAAARAAGAAGGATCKH